MFGTLWEVHVCPEGTVGPPGTTSTHLEGYYQLTIDGTLVCTMCGEEFDLEETLKDQMEALHKENRKVTRERDKLLALKWGLPWGPEVDLGETTEIMERINQFATRTTDAELLLRITELNGLLRKLADVTGE